MTGKEAIFEYLKTHKTFCSADVSAFSGVSHTGINLAASDLARKGLLVVDGKVWRTVYYRMVTDDEKEGRRSTNRIFQECRNSEAMKRVLAVYGRTQA